MPRQARNVFAHIPHHITQRGNRRNDVFFSDNDRKNYLKLLKRYCKTYRVDVLAYCLMTNHIHLILLPSTKDGLQNVLKPLHMRYAQQINKQNNWSGHLWQGRFFSSALDAKYTYNAFRYVENNPVRAKLVRKATDYKYSSARHHCGLTVDKLITDYDIGVKQEEYEKYLKEFENQEEIIILRRNINKNLPCGSDKFIKKLSNIFGKDLAFRNIGRPKKG